jgi:hypothetical protein
MGESHEADWEDLLARRLIKQSQEESAEAEVRSETINTDGAVETRSENGTAEENVSLTKIPVQTLETDSEKSQTATTAVTPMFAKVEKSLISLGFFTPSSRRIKDQRIKRISFTRSIDGKKVEATAEFHPSPVLGLPVTADQDKFLALNDIITNRLRAEGTITNPIRFTSADLLRILNNRVRTGKNYKDIMEWLDVMTATTIFSNGVVYEAGKKRFARDRFHVFQRAVSVGKELPDGTIADANYVWLSDWQLENINQNFLLPIDLQTYRELKNHISKALVPLLQVWLFASQRAGSFEKRYDELCEMLSLQTYKAPSLITRQLKPSLDELVRYEYLEKWRIEKTSDRKSYKIIFFHGSKFHRDRRRRLEQKNQNEPPIVIAESGSPEPDLPEPGKLNLEEPAGEAAVHPQGVSETASKSPGEIKKSTEPGTPATDIGAALPEEQRALLIELLARGVLQSTAVHLLRSFPAEQVESVGDYIDYWDRIPPDRERGKGPGLLIHLLEKRDPLPPSFETRRERKRREAAEDHNRKLRILKEALTTAYNDHREAVVDRFISEEITEQEFDRRVVVYLQEISKQSDLDLSSVWNHPAALEATAKRAVRSQIAEQVPMLPFEDFKKRELPRILAELQLDPAELGIQLPTRLAVTTA